MMVRSAVVLPAPLRPSSIVVRPAGRVEVDALKNVIAADVGMHALERQAGAHAAFPGAIPR